MIHVGRAAIESVKGKSLQLSNQSQLEVDAVIFATGWESPLNQMFTPEQRAELGLPVPWDALSETEAKFWKELDASEDRKVLDLYPIFENPPHKYINQDRGETPFRLFRGLIPPTIPNDDGNIVFLGKVANVQQTSSQSDASARTCRRAFEVKYVANGVGGYRWIGRSSSFCCFSDTQWFFELILDVSPSRYPAPAA